MSENSNGLSGLAMNTLSDIPTSDNNAQQIVALVKEEGRIIGYQLSDGRILNKDEGVRLAKDGGIKGVGISKRNGNEYLKSLPDGNEDNNLGSLPTVKH